MKLLREFVLYFVVFVLAFSSASESSENGIVQKAAESGENTVPRYALPVRQHSSHFDRDMIRDLEPSNDSDDLPELSPRGPIGELNAHLHASLKSFGTLPFKKGMRIANLLCDAIRHGIIVRRHHPVQHGNMSLIIKDTMTDNQHSIPLSHAVDLLTHENFQPELPLVILVTGWTTNHGDTGLKFVNLALDIMSKALRGTQRVNFVTLDSARFVSTLYSWSSFNTKVVGEMLGEALKTIIENGYPMEKIHLVGHSLGAHIVGSAGQYIRRKTGRMLPRITGLDPANPCFHSLVRTDEGLSTEDAEFVDVIHSNIGVLGKKSPTGHVDFYPNGLNPKPPSCNTIVCAHHFAVELFAESAQVGHENSFKASKCRDLPVSDVTVNAFACSHGEAVMGYAAENTTRGIYYIKTNRRSPYAIQ